MADGFGEALRRALRKSLPAKQQGAEYAKYANFAVLRECAPRRNRDGTGDPRGNTGALAISPVHGANRKRKTSAMGSS